MWQQTGRRRTTHQHVTAVVRHTNTEHACEVLIIVTIIVTTTIITIIITVVVIIMDVIINSAT